MTITNRALTGAPAPVARPLDQTRLATWALAAILAVLVLPPLIFLVRGGFTGVDGAPTLRNFARIFTDRRLFESAANSALFAFGSAAVALVFGGLIAWIVERTNAPLKGLAYLTTVISLGTPYVLYVGAWLFLLGKSGPINMLWRQWTGGTDPLINIYSLGGMIMIEGFLWSPLVFLLMAATFRNANPELEEAARMSGASVWETIRRVTLKLAMPALLALALLVFIRALEGFEVPALIGLPGRVNVLTTDIFLDMNAHAPPDLGHASAFSFVLLVIVAVLLYFYGRLSRSAERFATVTGKGFRPRPFDLGKGRYAAAAILVLNFVLLLAAPTLILIWASLLPFYQTIRVSAFRLLTLRNYEAVLASTHYLDLLRNTLAIAAGAATAVMAITLVAGWLAARRRPGSWALDQLATLPLVFPGIVLGVAVMQLFLNLPIPLYGTIWIIMWAFVIRYLPYGMRYSYAGMIQIHRELEEAAGVSGASAFEALHRIVAPLLLPALAAGWLFIFLLGARVLSLPILLAGPSSQTMAVAMYDLWSNGQGPELAALGLLWTAFMTVIACIFHIFSRRNAIATN
jgi:iron(III) transport system permease protein